MNNYLLALGSWNLFGSILMLGLFNESFGRKMLNEWTKIFSVEFKLDYWSKFWLAWAIGLNIFFGYINIFAAKWSFIPLMKVLVWTDLVAYTVFVLLAIWGVKTKRTGSGIYSVFVIFGGWIAWGIVALCQ